MPIYKFRAEATADVINGLNGVDFVLLEIIEPIESLPDCEVTISSDWSLEELQQHILSIDDCHVMAQTIQPIEKYTIERNYDLKLIPKSIKCAIDRCVEVGKIKCDLIKTNGIQLPEEETPEYQLKGLEQYHFRSVSIEGHAQTGKHPNELTTVIFKAIDGPGEILIKHVFKNKEDVYSFEFNKIFTHSELFNLLTSK